MSAVVVGLIGAQTVVGVADVGLSGCLVVVGVFAIGVCDAVVGEGGGSRVVVGSVVGISVLSELGAQTEMSVCALLSSLLLIWLSSLLLNKMAAAVSQVGNIFTGMAAAAGVLVMWVSTVVVVGAEGGGVAEVLVGVVGGDVVDLARCGGEAECLHMSVSLLVVSVDTFLELVLCRRKLAASAALPWYTVHYEVREGFCLPLLIGEVCWLIFLLFLFFLPSFCCRLFCCRPEKSVMGIP